MNTRFLSIILAILVLHVGVNNVFCAVGIGDKITISGVVKDESNYPVIGASVYLIAGTSKSGAVTDFDGKFKVSITSQNQKTFQIKVTYVGFKTANESYSISTLKKNQGTVIVNLVDDSRKNKKKDSRIIAQDFSSTASNNDFVFNFQYPTVSSEKTPEQLYKEGASYYFGTEGMAKDYTKAFKLFLPAATEGHAEAQFVLGYMYEYGQGTTKDYTKAVSWYKRAADQNHASAQCNLGLLYERGNGVTQNYTEAYNYYMKSAAQGSSLALNNLGNLYETGHGVKQSSSSALAYYNKAAEGGNEMATRNAKRLSDLGIKPNKELFDSTNQKTSTPNVTTTNKPTGKELFDLGLKYYNGEGVTKDYNKAFSYFSQSAEKGYAGGQNWLGALYENGEGTTKDYSKALMWYQKAANQGLANAQYNLADMYYSGKGIEKNYEQAVLWYQKAAEQGDKKAMNMLGICYNSGKGVPKNQEKSFSYYKMSAEKGYSWGQYNLGYKYYIGEGCSQDYYQAVTWLKKAAEQNNSSAQNLLGKCYENGLGVGKDLHMAEYYYKKSAEQDYASAQYNLAELYYSGKGVEQSYEQAVLWYQKAADQGEEKAMNMLGICYENGKGVTANKEKSFTYYKMSAEKGYSWGQYNLGQNLFSGEGCKQDYKQAVTWFKKAAEQNNTYGQNMLGRCYENGLGIEKDLNQAFLWYSTAAEQGYSSAQFNLGCLYYTGNGVEKDLKKAFELFRSAALQSNDGAQWILAWYYFDGEVVEKDIATALELIEKAAKQGEATYQVDAGYMYSEDSPYLDYEKAIYWTKEALKQNNAAAFNQMGWFYEHGNGVEKNLKTAYDNYKKAADLGHSGGMRHLAEFYENGWVVEKDPIEAVVWYKKAEDAGNNKAKEHLATLKNKFLGEIGSEPSEKYQEEAHSDKPNIELPPMGRRIALVIGNEDYKNTSLQLSNPVNDAKAMCKKLKQLGFDIFTLKDNEGHDLLTTDLDMVRMEETIQAFSEKASGYDVALFFYSGHAVQIDGNNYLIPTDLQRVKSKIVIQKKCCSMGDLMSMLEESDVKTKIYILDACRTNPSNLFDATKGIPTSGLANMPAPGGSCVAYATLAGHEAEDGKGMKNSPYTNALLKFLDEPGLEADKVFQKAGTYVNDITHGEQKPTYHYSIYGSFFFNYDIK